MTQQVLARGLPDVTRADVEEIARDEPAWLREKRLEAWALYESMDLPDPGDEEWRRTDVRAIPFEDLRVERTEETQTLSDDARADGVIFARLGASTYEYEALVRDRLYAIVKPGEWKYLALNAAMWDGGAFLYVPKGVEVELPLHMLTAGRQGQATAMFPRTLVIADRHSRVALIDESASADGQRAFVSSAVEIFVGDGAKVEYYDVNRWGDGVYNFKTVRAVLGRDARFLAMAAGIGSRLTKMRVDTQMPQPGARADLLGVTFGNGDQHFDYNTRQEHVGHHTVSELQFKSALTDGASLVWYGVTRINPGASGSEANQTSRNLLLSDHAKAAPIPVLEIEAWDVTRCSHGATAGPVDENELFYLQTRGISRRVAEQMLVEGFFADVLDRVPDARLRARVMSAVLEKAGGSAGRLTWDEVLAS